MKEIIISSINRALNKNFSKDSNEFPILSEEDKINLAKYNKLLDEVYLEISETEYLKPDSYGENIDLPKFSTLYVNNENINPDLSLANTKKIKKLGTSEKQRWKSTIEMAYCYFYILDQNFKTKPIQNIRRKPVFTPLAFSISSITENMKAMAKVEKKLKAYIEKYEPDIKGASSIGRPLKEKKKLVIESVDIVNHLTAQRAEFTNNYSDSPSKLKHLKINSKFKLIKNK